MKFFLVISIFILFNLSRANNNHNKQCNQGASTSRDREEDVNYFEKCEIQMYVNGVLNLAMEELSDDSNTDVPEEESPVSQYVRQMEDRLRYGECYEQNDETTPSLLSNYRQRREYFITIAVDNILDRILDVIGIRFPECLENFNSPIVYDGPLFQRYVTGADMYNLIIKMISRVGITENEMDKQIKNLLNDIKKNLTRPKRSTEKLEEKCHSIREYSEKRWKQLVLYLTSVFIKFHISEKSISWLCDFVNLHNEYKFHHRSNDDNCTKPTFGTYLYTKTSQIEDWHDCMDFDESRKPSEWCQAWRRIMLNSDLDFSEEVKKSNPSRLNQDLKTIVHWLSKRISFVNQKTSPKLPLIIASKNNTVCYREASSLSCPNICSSSKYRVMSARARRAISAPEDVIYDREWLKDMNNNLRCRCPEDKNSTSVMPITPRPGNWLSNLFGDSWRTRCDEGSPDRDTPRCTEFRRK